MRDQVCHGCGADQSVGNPVPRDATCAACGRDLRCCRNCRHWDERASGECRETEADLVADKWRRNFCEYFEWSPLPFVAPGNDDRAARARAQLDALFGGGTGSPSRDAGRGTKPGPGDSARARLEKLFRDPPEPPGE